MPQAGSDDKAHNCQPKETHNTHSAHPEDSKQHGDNIVMCSPLRMGVCLLFCLDPLLGASFPRMPHLFCAEFDDYTIIVVCGPAASTRATSCGVACSSQTHTHTSVHVDSRNHEYSKPAIPQGALFCYRDLCTTPFGLSLAGKTSCRTMHAAFVPNSKHLVLATLPQRWWATTGNRTPHLSPWQTS